VQKLTINRSIVEVTKNEAKEAHRIASMRTAGPEHAQLAADIWMRSAPNDKAQERRKAVARALGLSDAVAFL
jgi:hypothetical protein